MASYITLVDYIIFGLFLLLSVGVGAYHAWKAKVKAKNSEGTATENFLIGGRKMPTIPTALSLLTTFLSGITLLGAPAETYQRGLLFWIVYCSSTVAFLLSAVFFVPVLYKLSPISVYEYFQYRFNSPLLRQFGSVLFLLNTIFYMSVVMYAPSVALSGVTHVPIWPFILVVGAASTFYTTIGGLKAVVWTDTLQAVFMYAGVFTLIIKGTIDAGGISRIFELAGDLRRIETLTRLNPTPAQHNSVWIASFGGVAYWMSMYGLNQMALQRYCSLPSLRRVNLVIAFTVPCFVLLGTLACFLGLIILTYFYGCDPLETGQVDNQDQLAILFAVKVLASLPGMPGLFLACLFSGTLSTISSGMNSMSAVAWEDLIKHRIDNKSDQKAVLINKAMVFTFGVLATALAFVCESLGGIINSFVSMLGTLAGPVVGLFFLGIFFPRANKIGAWAGVIISEVFCIWICIGNFIYKPYKDYIIDTNSTCPYNITKPVKLYPSDLDLHFGDPDVWVLYKISAWAYGLIGILLVLIIGVPVSYLTPRKYHYASLDNWALTYCGRNQPMERVRFKESCVKPPNYEQQLSKLSGYELEAEPLAQNENQPTTSL